MEHIQEKAFKVWAGKYLYFDWVIEFHPEEKIWLMYPPTDGCIDYHGSQGATDAAQTLNEAKRLIDHWNT